MALKDFLKDLPIHNRDNFTKIHSGNDANSTSPGSKTSVASRYRPAMYVPTKDYPFEQEIVTVRTSILLHYLHQQVDKTIAFSAAQKKRESESPLGNEVARKKARLESLPNGSNSDPNVPSSSSSSRHQDH